MIQLRDTVLIRVPPERVWAWLSELPRHYRDWHPAHINCRYVRGDSLKVGAILQVDERLHGKAHSLKLRTSAVVPLRLLRYSSRGVQGAFLLEPADGGTRFTAELQFGLRWPLVGRVLDMAFGRVLAQRLSAIQVHMHEEGQSLKRLLESEQAAQQPNGAGAPG